MKLPLLNPFNCRATGRFHPQAPAAKRLGYSPAWEIGWRWLGNGRWSDVVEALVIADNFYSFSPTITGRMPRMLVSHRLRLVYDGLSLFYEREGLSMLKSLDGFPAVTGVKRTTVDVSVNQPRHRRHIVRFRRTPVPGHRRRGVCWS